MTLSRKNEDGREAGPERKRLAAPAIRHVGSHWRALSVLDETMVLGLSTVGTEATRQSTLTTAEMEVFPCRARRLRPLGACCAHHKPIHIPPRPPPSLFKAQGPRPSRLALPASCDMQPACLASAASCSRRRPVARLLLSSAVSTFCPLHPQTLLFLDIFSLTLYIFSHHVSLPRLVSFTSASHPKLAFVARPLFPQHSRSSLSIATISSLGRPCISSLATARRLEPTLPRRDFFLLRQPQTLGLFFFLL